MTTAAEQISRIVGLCADLAKLDQGCRALARVVTYVKVELDSEREKEVATCARCRGRQTLLLGAAE